MFTVYCIDDHGEKYLETDCATMDDVSSMLSGWVHEASIFAEPQPETAEEAEKMFAAAHFGMEFNGIDASKLSAAIHGKRATAAR